MERMVMQGGRRLYGEVTIQGAKNSVLPILAATVLSGDICVIEGCPRLRDVETTIEVLRCLGAEVCWEEDNLVVDTGSLSGCSIPDHLMRRMRSSVIFLGAVLGRCGEAELSYPGGCELGPRPVDLHLAALRSLGAEIIERGGRLRCQTPALYGTELVLSLPSVGATENAMLAACAAKGTTTICNAAREPEIVDLQEFLRKMGADVRGAGSSTVIVTGGERLHGCTHRVIPDRIVAATYLSAAAATGGDICLRGVDYRHLSAVTTALTQAGCELCCRESTIRLKSNGSLRSVMPIHTSPHPGFPTDAQAVVMAALCCAGGTTVFVEHMFTNRYRHVPELQRMGADIRLEGPVAVVCGQPKLHGAKVCAADLRGGAALVVAGLQAEGRSEVEKIEYIQRGYSDLVGDLQALGADIWLA